MTIDEIIAKEAEIAQEFQEVIDTHMVSEDMSLEEMYCDDTKVIQEKLESYKELSDYHSTIANTMRKYQEIRKIYMTHHYTDEDVIEKIKEVINKNKMGLTIDDAIKDIELTCEYLKNIGVLDNPANETCKPSLDMAKDIMKKYKTMQKVLEKVWNASSCMLDKTSTFNLECLNEIMETYRTIREDGTTKLAGLRDEWED